MSGLSFSAHSSPTLTLRSPTERHLAHAKRKLYQFVLREIDSVSQCTYRSCITSEPDDSTLYGLNLPLDILLKVMSVMEPTGAVSFVFCSTFSDGSLRQDLQTLLLRIPTIYFVDSAQQLDLSGLHLGISELGSREIFAVLYQHYNTLTKVVSLLKSMKSSATPTSVEQDKRQIEELFHSRLRIKSPWCMSLHDRVDRELANLTKTPQRSWQLFGNVLGLQLNIDDGFYKGECLHFHVHISEGYPHTPPHVRSLSSTLYHPLISENGDVNLPLLVPTTWSSSFTHDLREVILGIEKLFLDQSSLTSDFTL